MREANCARVHRRSSAEFASAVRRFAQPVRTLLTVLILGLCGAEGVQAQRLAELEVESIPIGNAVPVVVDLDRITHLPDSLIYLRTSDGAAHPFQVRADEARTLHWMTIGTGAPQQFVLERKDAQPPVPGLLRLRDDGERVHVDWAAAPLLGYQYAVMQAPPGIDSAYARSGFIHPLRTPAGTTLTRIQPEDHEHHYGIWNPWTQVRFRGRIVDFWNLGKREATVRFLGFAGKWTGSVFAEVAAVHEHIVFEGAEEIVALHELQQIRVYRPTDDSGSYLMDIVVVLTCGTDAPVELLEYRYGGLGWRGPEGWTHQNSTMVTSNGQGRADADGTAARWIMTMGAADEGTSTEYAGLTIFSHPANFNHPEPLRVWPPDQYEHGDVFVNLSPTKTKPWLLEPGRRYALRYRLLVFDGTPLAADMNAAWTHFADPPLVRVRTTATE